MSHHASGDNVESLAPGSAKRDDGFDFGYPDDDDPVDAYDCSPSIKPGDQWADSDDDNLDSSFDSSLVDETFSCDGVDRPRSGLVSTTVSFILRRLSTIDEDASTSTADSSDSFWRDRYGPRYDLDGGYQTTFWRHICRNNRGWIVVASVAIVLSCSLVWKKNHMAQPLPTYSRPPSLEEDDPANVAPLILTDGEQAALNYMNPLWYGRQDGYQGKSHKEAVDFCESIEGRQLCMAEAYCPNGSPATGKINPKPLYLRMDAFLGEQWVPTSINANSWLLAGTIDGNPATTCQLYEDVHNKTQPLWGFDGSSTFMKEHLMCCLKEVKGSAQVISSSDDNDTAPAVNSASSPEVVRRWFLRGYEQFHTYESDRDFCGVKLENGDLCAYEQVCPDGSGSSPFSPPAAMIDGQTIEQWVPITADDNNSWVLVGQEQGEDPDRICYTYDELYGDEAKFGDVASVELTKYLLCCGPPKEN
ncbi:hypothetical protein ACHAWF_018385 [Thalassiosira exigua]